MMHQMNTVWFRWRDKIFPNHRLVCDWRIYRFWISPPGCFDRTEPAANIGGHVTGCLTGVRHNFCLIFCCNLFTKQNNILPQMMLMRNQRRFRCNQRLHVGSCVHTAGWLTDKIIKKIQLIMVKMTSVFYLVSIHLKTSLFLDFLLHFRRFQRSFRSNFIDLYSLRPEVPQTSGLSSRRTNTVSVRHPGFHEAAPFARFLNANYSFIYKLRIQSAPLGSSFCSRLGSCE